MDAKVEFQKLECTGDASCLAGRHPDPPLDRYPLLAWAVSHPEHGSGVFLEDGSASVADVAVMAAESPNPGVVAERFGTTPDHVAQAVDYAIAAGFLGTK